MSTVTRDEFETVKELLASAARYAESSHRRLDQIAQQQQVNIETIASLGEKLDRLSIKIDQLAESQNRTQTQLDRLTESQDRTQIQLDRLTESQSQTQTQLDLLSLRATQVSERVDTFVSTAQFYFTRHGESIDQLKGISERLEGLLAYLIRKDQQG